jgi:hypothetical protein
VSNYVPLETIPPVLQISFNINENKRDIPSDKVIAGHPVYKYHSAKLVRKMSKLKPIQDQSTDQGLFHREREQE